jgi:hypothetical protein
MPMTPSSNAARRPTVDEWGVYDPQQAGLAALYSRLTTTPAAPAEPAEPAPDHTDRVPSAKPSNR